MIPNGLLFGSRLLRLAASHRHALLGHGRLAIGVQKLQLVKRVHLESESSFVTVVDLREVLEDLLKRGLLDTVLLNVEFLLLLLDLPEEEPNGLVLSWQAKLVEVTTLLEKFNVFEHAAHGSNQPEATLLNEAELYKG